MIPDIIPLSERASVLLSDLKRVLKPIGSAGSADDVLCDADPRARVELYRHGWIAGFPDVDPSTLEPYVCYALTPAGCRLVGVNPASGLERSAEKWRRPYWPGVKVWRASEVAVAGRRNGCVAVNALGGIAWAEKPRDAAAAALFALANRLGVTPPVAIPPDADLDGENHPGLWTYLG